METNFIGEHQCDPGTDEMRQAGERREIKEDAVVSDFGSWVSDNGFNRQGE